MWGKGSFVGLPVKLQEFSHLSLQIAFHISLRSNSTVQRWIGLFMLQITLDEKQVTLKKIGKGGSDIKNKFQKEEGGTFCL